MNKIDQFKDEYYFLSNFYSAQVEYDGIVYHNNEAAFQAQKCQTNEEKIEFSKIKNPSEAKGKGRRVPNLDVEKWNESRIQIMKDICLAKFIQNEDLKEKLIQTGEAELIEGNTWNDTFWGINIRTGKGQNHLGKILMEIRDELKG